MHKKNNKKIIIGSILATVLTVAALSTTSNIVENTDINFGNEAVAMQSSLSSERTLHTQADVDAIFAPWVSSFKSLPGNVGIQTTTAINWATYTYVDSAYIDLYNEDTKITSTFDVTGMDTFTYYFQEAGTYTVKARVSFNDTGADEYQDSFYVVLGTGVTGTTADATFDAIYDAWTSSVTAISEGGSVIGFKTTGEVDLSKQPMISNAFLVIKDGTKVVDKIQLAKDGVEDKTLEYYFETAGTYDIVIETVTTNHDIYNTTIKSGFSTTSAADAVDAILKPAADSFTEITDDDFDLIAAGDKGTIGYEITGTPKADDYAFIESIEIIETPSVSPIPMIHPVNSTGIEYFTYDDSVKLEFLTTATNGQYTKTEITTEDIEAKDVKDDISPIYEEITSTMTIDKSGVVLETSVDLPSFVKSAEIELENGEGTVEKTPYGTLQADEGFTFNFTTDDQYRLVAHTTLNNNTGAGDSWVITDDPDAGMTDGEDGINGGDVIYSTYIDDINGAHMVNWADGGAQGFDGYRSKQEDVNKVFANLVTDVKPKEYRSGFTIDSTFVNDGSLTFTSSLLQLIDESGNVYTVKDITSDIKTGTISLDFDFKEGQGYDVDSTYKLITHNVLDSGAVYESVIFEGQLGYLFRTDAEVKSLYTDPTKGGNIVVSDLLTKGEPAETGYKYGVSVDGTYAEDTSYLVSSDIQLKGTTTGKTYWVDELDSGTVALTQEFEADDIYEVNVVSKLTNGQTITNTIATSQGWLDRTDTGDEIFKDVVATQSTYKDKLTITNTPTLSGEWAVGYDVVIVDSSDNIVPKDSAGKFEYTFVKDDTYTYHFVLTHQNGDTIETTPKSITGYRLRTAADMATSFSGLKSEIKLGDYNSSVIMKGPVNLTDDKITKSEIFLFNDDSTNDATATPVDTYTLYDKSEGDTAPTAVDHTFDIPLDDKYHVVARTTYENGQVQDYTLYEEFDGYQVRGQTDVDALFTDFAYTQPVNNQGVGTNYSSIDITGKFDLADWVTSAEIQLVGSDGTVDQKQPLVDGDNTISFTGLEDNEKYTINIHVILNNGNEFDSKPIKDTITGYTVRTQDDVDAIYLNTDDTSILTSAMGTFGKDVTISGTLALPTWLKEAKLSILDSKGKAVYTSAAPLTNTVNETFAFTEDDVYSVKIHSVLNNTDEFDTVILTGIEGFADRGQTDVDKLYENLVVEISAVADSTPPAGVTIGASETATEIKISGDVATDTWVKTQTLSILDSSDAVVKTLDLSTYDKSKGFDFAFTKDDKYRVKVVTELTNGNSFTTWLMGDATTTSGEQGYVYHGPTAVNSEYSITGTVSTPDKTALTIKGATTSATWITSSTLDLVRTDVVDSSFDQTYTIPKDWDPATGITANFPEDGTYKLTLTSKTVNGGTYTIDLGSFDGLKIRDTNDITDIYKSLVNTLGAVDATNGESNTKITVAGNVAMPTWVKSAELQLIKGADVATGTVEDKIGITAGGDINKTFEFKEDSEYIINVHTVLNNTTTQDDQIGTKVTGYKTRTEAEVKAAYPLTVDAASDTSHKTVTVNGLPTTKPAFVTSAVLKVYKSDDATNSTLIDSSDITNNTTGTTTLTYGQDGTFKIVLDSELTNGAKYSYTLTGGDSLTGWGTHSSAEVDALYTSVTAAYGTVIADNGEKNTSVIIGGSATTAAWVKSQELRIYLGTDLATATLQKTISIGADGSFTATTYPFPQDGHYIISAHTILENGDEFDTPIKEGDGNLSYDKTTVGVNYENLAAASSDPLKESIIVNGEFVNPGYIATSTLTLIRTDATGVTADQTFAIPTDWDSATGHTFTIVDDGTYKVEVTSLLTNGATYTYEVAKDLTGYAARTEDEIKAVFDPLAVTLSLDKTSITIAGDLSSTWENWIKSATINLIDAGTDGTGTAVIGSKDILSTALDVSETYAFTKDSKYSVNISVELNNGFTYTYQEATWINLVGYKLIDSSATATAYGSLTASSAYVKEEATGNILSAGILVSGNLGSTEGFATSTIVLHRTDDTTGAEDQEFAIDYATWDGTKGTTFVPTVDGNYNVTVKTTLTNTAQTPLADYAVNSSPINIVLPSTEDDLAAAIEGSISGEYTGDTTKPGIQDKSELTLKYPVTIDKFVLFSKVDVYLNDKNDATVNEHVGTIDNTSIDESVIKFDHTSDGYYLSYKFTLKAGYVFVGYPEATSSIEFNDPEASNAIGIKIPNASGTPTRTIYFTGETDFSTEYANVYSNLTLTKTLTSTVAGVKKYDLLLSGKIQENDFLDKVTFTVTKNGSAGKFKVITRTTDLAEISGQTALSTTYKVPVIGDAEYKVNITSEFTAAYGGGNDGVGIEIPATPASAAEALSEVEYVYSEATNTLSLSGDIKKSDIENVETAEIVLFKDGQIYSSKEYAKSKVRTLSQSENEEYIHIEESLELTETGDYEVQIKTTMTSGETYSVSKGTQTVEEINQPEEIVDGNNGNNNNEIGAFGWISIIAAITILPMLFAYIINKMKSKK